MTTPPVRPPPGARPPTTATGFLLSSIVYRSRARLSVIVLLTICAAPAASAQSPTKAARDSVGRVVQRFYDWYLPRSLQPRTRDVVMQAATNGPIPFDTVLVHWLRVDSTARAQAKDEIDGLDGDPYLNSQDPCERYTVNAIGQHGGGFLVDVVGHGGCAAHRNPDVTVELRRRAGRWTIAEFLYPDQRDARLIPLLRRLHPNAR